VATFLFSGCLIFNKIGVERLLKSTYENLPKMVRMLSLQ
jgi:hypothetical protein